jgi:hypothetical protein
LLKAAERETGPVDSSMTFLVSMVAGRCICLLLHGRDKYK